MFYFFYIYIYIYLEFLFYNLIGCAPNIIRTGSIEPYQKKVSSTTVFSAVFKNEYVGARYPLGPHNVDMLYGLPDGPPTVRLA